MVFYLHILRERSACILEDSSHSSHSSLGMGGASLLHRDVLSCILRGEGRSYAGRVEQGSSLRTKQGSGHVLPRRTKSVMTVVFTFL